MMYSAVRPFMQTGDFIGCRGSNWLQRTIRCLRGGRDDLSHVMTVDRCIEDGNERVRILQMEATGARWQYLSELLGDEVGQMFWVPMYNTPWQQETIKKLASWLIFMQIKYNYCELFSAMVSPIILEPNPKKFVCSENFWWFQRRCCNPDAVAHYDNEGRELAPYPGDTLAWLCRALTNEPLEMGA